MEDAELTRLAIAEIVREMGELKEPQVQERKINPIAKPNKRFLGRTLNSVLSHNKRENDRTQENCRKKLKELDERRNESKPMRSSNRSASRELVLSTSTEEDRTKYLKKSRKRDKKSKSKKYKKRKKVRDESKRRKSSRYDSSDSCSSSSRSTSRSRSRSRCGRSRKTYKDLKSRVNVNEEEGEQTHCEPDMDAALQLEAALMNNSYRQHQIHQLLYYSALMAGNETLEIDTLQEELQISDADILEPQVDIKSISSAVSNLEESDSEASEILQISLSSATSTSSKARSSKNLRRKNVKEKESKKKSELSDSSSGVIWELDSESSKGCTYSKEGHLNEKQESNNECICIGSETDTDTDNETDSDNTTSDTESGSENATNVPNNVCHTATETVTLLSSSDSEVEIVTDSNANSSAQGSTGIDSAAIAAYSTANLLNSLENVTDTDSLPSLVKDTTVFDVSSKLILTSPQQTTTNPIGEPSIEGVAEESSHVTDLGTSFTISTECILSDALASATDVNVFTAESKSTIEDVTILSADIDKFATESQPPTERMGLEHAQKEEAIVEESESLEDSESQPTAGRICLEHAQEVNTTIVEELESQEGSESQPTAGRICLEGAQKEEAIVEESESLEDSESQQTTEKICLEGAQKEEVIVEESESLEDSEFQPPTERICLEHAQKEEVIVEELESQEGSESQQPTERIWLEQAQEVNTTIVEESESLEDSENQQTTEKICLEHAQEVNTTILEELESREEITAFTVTNESSNSNIIATGSTSSLGNVTIASVDIGKLALESLTTTYSEETKPTKGTTPDADLSVSESNCGEVVMESMGVSVAKTPLNLSVSHNSDSSFNSPSKTSASPLPTDLESDAIQNENKPGIVPSELYDRQVSSLDNLANSAPS
ncbi:serine-rich adhesin for platelets [Anastrepha obliqua]|uniref:serine-rich adhesin for platelets n=1 Tax=Anastrepha obliqua TaxID=95512 RepID=UPI00240938FA|nr:serine-rich adhesin for platelets [Anastrepha obliqua]